MIIFIIYVINIFDNVRSNNPQILENNPRLWYNVKCIQLPVTLNYDIDFLKKLKMKMPKLTSIKFGGCEFLPEVKTQETSSSNEEIDVTLDNVTTIEFTEGYIEDQKDLIISSLPNLRHFILSCTELPSVDRELTPLLNERIQQFDLYEKFGFKQLRKINYVYFTNVQHINIYLHDASQVRELYLDVIKVLRNFKNLKTLFICTYWPKYNDLSLKGESTKFIKYLEINGIMKKYQVKYFEKYCLFLKREFNDSGVEDSVLGSLRKSSFFSGLIRSLCPVKRS